MNLHEQVNIPKLLMVGGLAETMPKARSALTHGQVYVEQWNISVAEATLPRWVLRGVTVRVGDRSMRISDDGSKILRSSPAQETLEHAC